MGAVTHIKIHISTLTERNIKQTESKHNQVRKKNSSIQNIRKNLSILFK